MSLKSRAFALSVLLFISFYSITSQAIVPIRFREATSDERPKHGQRTVTTAGTAVQLSTVSVPCYEIAIQAKRTNTGRIYIGGAGIGNNDTGGVMLNAEDIYTDYVTDLQQIYINSSVDGEGVTYIYKDGLP
jgi:hypothetical protein